VLLEYKNAMELWHTISKYEVIEQKYVGVVLNTFLKMTILVLFKSLQKKNNNNNKQNIYSKKILNVCIHVYLLITFLRLIDFIIKIINFINDSI